MAGDPREVGTAYVTVKAKIDDAEQNLDKVKDKMEEVDKTTTTVTDNSNRKFGQMAEGVQTSVARQVGAITGLIGSVTAVVGVLGLFLSAGKKVGDMLFANEERARKFEGAISSLDRALDLPARRLEDLSDTFARANDELGIRISEDDIVIAETLKKEKAELEAEIEGMRQILERTERESKQRAQRNGPDLSFTTNTILDDRRREFQIAQAKLEDLENQISRSEGLVLKARKQLQELDRDRAAQELRDAAAKAKESINKEFADPIRDRVDELTRQFGALNDLVGDGELGIDAKGQELLEAVRALSELGLAEFPKSLQDANRINNDLVGKLLKNDEFRQILVEVLGDIPKSIVELQKQQKELPDKIGKAIEDGTRRVLESTGLLATAQTLAAIRTNSDLIVSETRRLAQ